MRSLLAYISRTQTSQGCGRVDLSPSNALWGYLCTICFEDNTARIRSVVLSIDHIFVSCFSFSPGSLRNHVPITVMILV